MPVNYWNYSWNITLRAGNDYIEFTIPHIYEFARNQFNIIDSIEIDENVLKIKCENPVEKRVLLTNNDYDIVIYNDYTDKIMNISELIAYSSNSILDNRIEDNYYRIIKNDNTLFTFKLGYGDNGLIITDLLKVVENSSISISLISDEDGLITYQLNVEVNE